MSNYVKEAIKEAEDIKEGKKAPNVLSFDCGTKTLAYALLDRDTGIMTCAENNISDKDSIKQARKLSEALDRIPMKGVGRIIIERQMNINTKAKCIQEQLVLYFTMLFPKANVILMSPSAKGKLAIGGFVLSDFVKKYSNKYYANKKHSLAMMNTIKDKVSCSKLTHNIADACLQIYVWLLSTQPPPHEALS